MRQILRSGRTITEETHRATSFEVLFDVVFVFALTRVIAFIGPAFASRSTSPPTSNIPEVAAQPQPGTWVGVAAVDEDEGVLVARPVTLCSVASGVPTRPVDAGPG
jgi:hypothetical protein